jgi:hypothetical protein
VRDAAPGVDLPARQGSADPVGAAPAPVDRTARLLSWLERDNLPRTTLTAALGGLPRLPDLPGGTGLVIAVIGDRRSSLRLCRAMAKACGADPSQVVLAAPPGGGRGTAPAAGRIVDVTDATRERLAWRRRALPTFVAVDCPAALRGDGPAWARDVVAALEAHRVIGVVRAGRKVEDVAAWVELVGGVDGLALEALEETSTPYAVLALEIPVAYLDALEATPATWAQALLEGAAA